ncbi:MAG: MFS transporter [Bacteriovoracia bacterium]
MNKYLSVFSNKRMLTTLLLGFSGGLPLALVGSTLQAWLARSNVDIVLIGQFALIQYPYALKFLWAPFMDNKPLPFLGLRRGWLVVSQIGLFAATWGLGSIGNPSNTIALFSLLAFLLAFFSASQDIVIDAYRTEIIEDEKELGAGASTYITGYRIATLVSGGVALGLVDQIGWKHVYFLMASINLVGLVTVLLSKEPKVTREVKTQTGSFTKPFIEFFQRSGAMEILIFVMVYKLSTLMATALTTKFLVDLGYSNLMIGTVNKGAGLIATIAGTLAGGALMAKLGLKRSLWVFGILQAMVGLTFCALSYLASHGGEIQNLGLVMVVSIDNFFMGMGTAALTGFLMHVCSKRYTATHYALLTSVMAVGRVVLIAHAGTLVAWMGYNWFFIATVPLAIPGLLLLRRYDFWEKSSGQLVTTKVPKFELGLMVVMMASLLLLSSDPVWRFLDKKALGTEVALLGAFGVLAVVALGLLKPQAQRT